MFFDSRGYVQFEDTEQYGVAVNSLAKMNITDILVVINEKNDTRTVYLFGSGALYPFRPNWDFDESDLDFMIVGECSEDELYDTAKTLSLLIREKMVECSEIISTGLMEIRAVDGTGHQSTIQIVLRKFESIDAFASEVDIAATCTIFDGSNVLFTGEAHIEHVQNTICVNPHRFSVQTPARILKYSKRFAIAFPNLNIESITAPSIVELPCGLEICVDYIKGLFIKAALKYTRVPTVSYDSGMDMAWKCDVPYINIIYLLRNKHFIRSDSKLKSSLVLKDIVSPSQSKKAIREIVRKTIDCRLQINIRYLRIVFGMTEDEVLEIVRQLYTEAVNVDTLRRRLMEKLERFYTQSENVRISFLRVASMIVPIAPSLFYGDLFIAKNTNNTAVQLSTLKAITNVLMCYDRPTCSICMQTLSKNEKNIVKFDCGHSHHFSKSTICEGVYNWIRSNSSCPMCRTRIVL
jgi:hypothetical protein